MLTRKKQPNPGIAESSLCSLTNSPSAELDCGEESDSELDSEFLNSIGFSTSDLPIVSQPSLLLDNQLPTFDHSLPLDDQPLNFEHSLPLDDRPPNFDHSLPLDDRPLSFENSLPLDNQPSLDPSHFPHKDSFSTHINNDQFFWDENFSATMADPLWNGDSALAEGDDQMQGDPMGEFGIDHSDMVKCRPSSRTILILEDVQPETLKSVMFTLFQTDTKLIMITGE
jgi:hypothetical protein